MNLIVTEIVGILKSDTYSLHKLFYGLIKLMYTQHIDKLKGCIVYEKIKH